MTDQHQIQSSTLPPAQPSYVLRGHSAQVHAVTFLRGNSQIVTGDADGWVVLWSTATKRALAVWRAHTQSILGLTSWDDDKIVTHGRDHKLYVWQIRSDGASADYSTVLPIDDQTSERKQPWLLHHLEVNALNFCAFSMCKHVATNLESAGTSAVLIATPGLKDGHINLTVLPDDERLATIGSPGIVSTGMVMALSLHDRAASAESKSSPSTLFVAAGYESGHAGIWRRPEPSSSAASSPSAAAISAAWQLVYLHQSHTQPVLSLCIAPAQNSMYTSSADAILARHAFPADDDDPAAAAAIVSPAAAAAPTKLVQTKHAGQQSLAMRSDGRIFATAGWDGRARVYSAKTMQELAVLKWHREGCYALALAEILDEKTSSSFAAKTATAYEAVGESRGDAATASSRASTTALVGKSAPGTLAAQRETIARSTHWLALGSKDGKVSLWSMY